MLKERNANFDKMFDQERNFRYKLNKDAEGNFRFKYVSDTFASITGISPENAENMLLSELIHQDDEQKVLSHLNNILQGKPNTERFRIKGKDGSYVQAIDYAKPVWDSENAIVEEIKGSASIEVSSKSKVSEN